MQHFEDFVVGHFRQRAHDILLACQAYKEGAHVGSVVKEGTQNTASHDFKEAVGKMMKTLIANFIKNGSKDCEQFQISA